MALTRTWRYARQWRILNGLGSSQEQTLQDSSSRLGFSVTLYAIAKSLSGGNLQRMIILREMAHDPRLIIASYLTRGLDVQSTIAARQALVQARDERRRRPAGLRGPGRAVHAQRPAARPL